MPNMQRAAATAKKVNARTALKRVLTCLLYLFLTLLLAVGGYVLYIVLQYSRIADGFPLQLQNPQAAVLQPNQEYSALTYNVGFGAYDHAFSFFMDSGVMKDGTKVNGKSARAQSAEVVQRNTAGAAATAQAHDADFILLQEVDKKAGRSFGINQTAAFMNAFPGHASAYASNFHSAYLAWPLHQHHGAVEAGLVSFSRYQVGGALRRSLPVDDGFPARFFDLDRCFMVLRLPVEGGGELILANVHMSAYDEGGLIRAAQMEMLAGFMAQERKNGNWVVVGGDTNHALNGTEQAFPSQQQTPGWVAVFDDAMLPEGFRVVQADNVREVATCRSTDIPYEAGVNYSAVLDGFMVSDNVSASAVNIDANFEYSDHNPVLLAFTLKKG